MSSPVVDSYLDELLAELPALSPGEQAASGQASAGMAVPEPEPMPAPGPEPEPEPEHASTPEPVPEPVPAPPAAPAAPAIAAAAPAPAPAPAPSPRPPAAPPPGAGPPPRAHIRTEPPDAIPRKAAPPTQRWLRVALGRDHYAFELLRVQEVVRMAPIVAMRGADPAVLGVMNLRGRIVPVFDLGRWLGGADVEVGERARIVVVERDDELIGVLVADVEDVASLGREHIEPPLAGSDAGAIVGIARVGHVPTVLLDANALFE